MRFVLAAAALLPTAAFAQTQCAPINVVIDFLTEKHKEAPVVSMNRGGVRAMIFAAQDGSSWTMVILKDDQLCIVADGTDFRAVSPGGRVPGTPPRSS